MEEEKEPKRGSKLHLPELRMMSKKLLLVPVGVGLLYLVADGIARKAEGDLGGVDLIGWGKWAGENWLGVVLVGGPALIGAGVGVFNWMLSGGKAERTAAIAEERERRSAARAAGRQSYIEATLTWLKIRETKKKEKMKKKPRRKPRRRQRVPVADLRGRRAGGVGEMPEGETPKPSRRRRA